MNAWLGPHNATVRSFFLRSVRPSSGLATPVCKKPTTAGPESAPAAYGRDLRLTWTRQCAVASDADPARESAAHAQRLAELLATRIEADRRSGAPS